MTRSVPTSYTPSPGSKPSLRDLRWLVSYAIRGATELVKARIAFSRFKASEIADRNEGSRAASDTDGPIDPSTIARIAYVIPRIASRVPWRSDCLVQAIAAQNWLSSIGIASEIQIGVERPREGEFSAHAWLMCAGNVVTGGDISQYEVLLADSGIDR